ncbi:hypothetical protein GCM10023317_84570 [Actinopolymorpha pittospori]
MVTGEMRFTTKELSKRTWPDFERFFSQVHGCACTLYLHGRHLPSVARTATERAERFGVPDRSRSVFPARAFGRAQELSAVKELVWQGRAHGILVYGRGEPVGWCHFGRASALPVVRDDRTPPEMVARHPSSDWRITCFTTRMDYRRRGVATTALAAALEAIRQRGGGWIEATPIAFPHNDPTVRKLRKTYRWRSQEVIDYLEENWPHKEVPGVGSVNACLTTAKSMSHAGTMSMFERFGFQPTKRDEYRSSDRSWDPGDSVVMRLQI